MEHNLLQMTIHYMQNGILQIIELKSSQSVISKFI